jgi:hypothetical protein
MSPELKKAFEESEENKEIEDKNGGTNESSI